MVALLRYLCLGLLACPVYAMQDLAQEAPMLNQPYFSQDKAEQSPVNIVGTAEFTKLYRQAKQPAIVVLFGRTLDDVVSDWKTDLKLNVSTEVKNTAQSTTPNAVSTDFSLQTRDRQQSQKSGLLTPDQWQELERGFMQATLAYRLKLVNQQLAVRLLDAERRDSVNKLATTDSKQLEIDVIRKHSPLLIEITPYQETNLRKEFIGFTVTFSSLQDATIVAQQRISLDLAAAKWQAGSSGYELAPVSDSKEYIPTAGGYSIVNQPTEFWFQQGQQLGNRFIQMFYDSWLTTAF